MTQWYHSLNIQIKKLSPERVVGSFKTALACLIGIILSKLLHLSMPQWVLITIVVVMATNIRIGGTIKKSYLRLLGTVVGAVLASGILLLLGQHPYIILALLVLSLAIFSYLASSSTDISQLGLLGAATVIMILDAQNPTLRTAGDRTVEIFIGIAIAVLVSRFVFPTHAKKQLLETIASTLKQFQSLYELFVTKELTSESLAEQEKIENDVLNKIINQNTLLQESESEDRRVKKKRQIYHNIFLLERKLLRCIYMLRQTLLSESTQIRNFFNNKNWVEFHHQIINLFDFINAICLKQTPTTTLPEKESVHQLIDKIIQGLLHSKSPGVTYRLINVHAFQFCLEHLINVLYEIERLLQKLNADLLHKDSGLS